jgi:hypothetical protein
VYSVATYNSCYCGFHLPLYSYLYIRVRDVYAYAYYVFFTLTVYIM